jgi:aspartate/methionine/tyrosine aminotransferase
VNPLAVKPLPLADEAPLRAGLYQGSSVVHAGREMQLTWRPTGGAYFALVGVEGCSDSAGLATDILHTAHVVTIPGSVFGQHGEGYLHPSYGSVELPDLCEACERLSHFFAVA